MKKIRKFAILGTLSTGKTSVVNLLRDKYKNKDVIFVSEAARDFIKKFGKQDRSSEAVQGKIQDIILRKEKEAHAQNPVVIVCDRCTIDSPIYLQFYKDKKGSKKLLKKVRKWILTYDKFLLFSPKGTKLVRDNIRTENENTRLKIHKTYLAFFKETNLPMELINGTFQQKLEKTEKILNSFLTNKNL